MENNTPSQEKHRKENTLRDKNMILWSFELQSDIMNQLSQKALAECLCDTHQGILFN